MIDGWTDKLAEWTDTGACERCGQNHKSSPVVDYVMRSLDGGLWRTAAVDPQYAERKLEALANQLAPQKWAKEPFDPRPAGVGDTIRNTKPMVIRASWGDKYHQLIYALADAAGLPNDSARRGFSHHQHPGTKFAPSNLWTIHPGQHRHSSPVALPASHEVFIDFGDGEQHKVPLTDEIKDIIGDGSWITPFVQHQIVEPKIVARATPYEGDGADKSYAEVLLAYLKTLPPEAATIYPWLAEEMKAKRFNPMEGYHQAIIDNAIPYIEWQRLYGDREAGGGGFDPKSSSLRGLESWVDELDNLGLDPETNQIHWDDEGEKIWEDKKGNYVVAMDADSEDLSRHGDILEHCYADPDSSYGEDYRGPVRDGRQKIFGLRSASGRPLAVAFVGVRKRGEDNAPFPHSNNWVSLEARARGNQPLNEGSEDASGKHPVAPILDQFYKDMGRMHHVEIDRDEENGGGAYNHHEYGGEERMPEERREDYPVIWRDGDEIEIDDISDLLGVPDDFGAFGWDGDTEYEDEGDYGDDPYAERIRGQVVTDIDWHSITGELAEEILRQGDNEEHDHGYYDEDDLSRAIAALAVVASNHSAHYGYRGAPGSRSGDELATMAATLQRKFLTSPISNPWTQDPLSNETTRIATRVVGELNVAKGAVDSIGHAARGTGCEDRETGQNLERLYESILHGFEVLKSDMTDLYHGKVEHDEPLQGVTQSQVNPFMVDLKIPQGVDPGQFSAPDRHGDHSPPLPGVTTAQVPLSSLTTQPKFQVGDRVGVGYFNEPSTVTSRTWTEQDSSPGLWVYNVKTDNPERQPAGVRETAMKALDARYDGVPRPIFDQSNEPTMPSLAKVAAPVCRHCGEPAKTIMRFTGDDEVPACLKHETYEADVRRKAGDPYRYERIKVAVLAPITTLRRSDFHFGAEQDIEAWYALARKGNQKAVFQLRKPVTLEVRGGKVPVPGAQSIGESKDGLPIYRTLDLGWHPELQQRVNADSGPNGAPEQRDQYADLQPGRRGEVIDIEPMMKMVHVQIPLHDVGKLHPHYAQGWLEYGDVAALGAAGDPFRPRK